MGRGRASEGDRRWRSPLGEDPAGARTASASSRGGGAGPVINFHNVRPDPAPHGGSFARVFAMDVAQPRPPPRWPGCGRGCMSKLLRAGFFREMPTASPPTRAWSPRAATRPVRTRTRSPAYLEAGQLFIATPAPTPDVLDRAKLIRPSPLPHGWRVRVAGRRGALRPGPTMSACRPRSSTHIMANGFSGPVGRGRDDARALTAPPSAANTVPVGEAAAPRQAPRRPAVDRVGQRQSWPGRLPAARCPAGPEIEMAPVPALARRCDVRVRGDDRGLDTSIQWAIVSHLRQPATRIQ